MRWLILGFILLAAGCGGTPDDPKVELRAWVERAVQAVESGSVMQSADLISTHYRDDKGYDMRGLVRLLLGYFHRHKSIHLLTHVDEPTISPAGDKAEMTVHAAMAGVPVASVDALFSVKADFHRFDLKMIKLDGEWLLESAVWHRSTLDDFTAF